MNKVYHLASCSTCQRIIKDLDLAAHFELQDIKSEPITAEQIDQMAKLSGTYESLFSRRAIKYRAMDLGSKDLKEMDYRKLILEEYTFLKRPVTIWNDKIYIGNSAKETARLAADLSTKA